MPASKRLGPVTVVGMALHSNPPQFDQNPNNAVFNEGSGTYVRPILSGSKLAECFSDAASSWKDIPLNYNPVPTEVLLNDLLSSFWRAHVPEKANDSAVEVSKKYFPHQSQFLQKMQSKYSTFEPFLESWCSQNCLEPISLDFDNEMEMAFEVSFGNMQTGSGGGSSGDATTTPQLPSFDAKLHVVRPQHSYVDSEKNKDDIKFSFDLNSNYSFFATFMDPVTNKIVLATIKTIESIQWIVHAVMLTLRSSEDLVRLDKHLCEYTSSAVSSSSNSNSNNPPEKSFVHQVGHAIMKYEQLTEWHSIIIQYAAEFAAAIAADAKEAAALFDTERYLTLLTTCPLSTVLDTIWREHGFHPLRSFEQSTIFFQTELKFAKDAFVKLSAEAATLVNTYESARKALQSSSSSSSSDSKPSSAGTTTQSVLEELSSCRDKCFSMKFKWIAKAKDAGVNIADEMIALDAPLQSLSRHVRQLQFVKEWNVVVRDFRTAVLTFSNGVQLQCQNYVNEGTLPSQKDLMIPNQSGRPLADAIKEIKRMRQSTSTFSSDIAAGEITDISKEEDDMWVRGGITTSVYCELVGTDNARSIYDAIQCEDVHLLKEVLGDDPNVAIAYDYEVGGPMTAFEVAATLFQKSPVQVLIMEHPAFNWQHMQVYRGLAMSATKCSHFVQQLANHPKMDINNLRGYPNLAVVQAAEASVYFKEPDWAHTVLTELLSAQGFDINSSGRDGVTPLMTLVEAGVEKGSDRYEGAIKHCLAMPGLKVHQKDKNGTSAFMYVASKAHLGSEYGDTADGIWLLELICERAAPTKVDIDKAWNMSHAKVKAWLTNLKKDPAVYANDKKRLGRDDGGDEIAEKSATKKQKAK